MGTDIHWILERRTKSGDWVGAQSSLQVTARLYHARGGHAFHASDWEILEYKLRERNYALFSALSNVRSGYGSSLAMPPLMNKPDGAALSMFSRWEYLNAEGHSLGYALGSDILTWTHPDLDTFPALCQQVADKYQEAMQGPIFDGEYKAIDLIKECWQEGIISSAHQALLYQRKDYNTLADPKDPNHWRMVVYYDS